MLETGAAYLRIVGPAYGFFGLGLSLYFASQGAGRLLWPLLAGLVRLRHRGRRRLAGPAPTGSLTWVFAALAAGAGRLWRTLVSAVASGVWFRHGSMGMRD